MRGHTERMHRGGTTQRGCTGEGPHRRDAQGRGYAEGLQKGASVNREPVLEIHWFPWEVMALSLR